MALRAAGIDGRFFLWNAGCVDRVDDRLFDINWWRERDALAGAAKGRGAAHFVAGLDGRYWLLRHNRRGGALSHFNHDRFLWSGIARARPFRELKLLATMRMLDLPVPEPVAARAVRNGAMYRGDVITIAIDRTRTLADRLMTTPMPAAAWQRLGAVLARFHRAGVWHADLNARNILVDPQDGFHLIDFDKARQRTAGRWRQANLARLRRSLGKIRDSRDHFHCSDADWDSLHDGYASLLAASL